jgi:hypothetical protein
MLTPAFVPPGGMRQGQGLMAVGTRARLLSIQGFKQLATAPAHKHVRRMADVFGKQEVGEQIRIMMARIATDFVTIQVKC